MDAGKSMAFEISSYLSLFPMVLISAGILLVLLWKAGGLSLAGHKVIAVAMLVAVAYLSFDSSSRFQFLGWIMAATIIFTAGLPSTRKALLVLVGLVVAATLFAVAGALRNEDDPDVALQEESVNRFAFASDANMLDGFVLLRQVYPDMLPYSYGQEHLEILTRPIPRAWWPDKPVGGYLNKLGIVDANSGFTLGISPSLFGSFYQEGGIPGLVLLSALYGFLFGRLTRLTAVINPLGGLLIRAIVCAAVVPLLRGGDLPGIYAWFGMAFWPCFLVLWFWRKELFAKQSEVGAQHSVPMARPVFVTGATK
jgi:oligosaccharide repeat unit polymerase